MFEKDLKKMAHVVFNLGQIVLSDQEHINSAG